uniref:DUF3615 domain-containing protein n=1 Tax=Triticum urartu TaxID=4572 RepID=A0A8R7R5T4_TRIUA
DSSFGYADDASFEAFVCLRGCDEFAISALEHYNKEQIKDGIKYALVKPIISWRVMDDGSYYHVNFTAKSTLEENPEEFFFAVVHYDCDTGGWVPTCIVSMDEDEGVGGIQYSVHESADPQHCYYCGEEVKHPVDGSLFEAGN